MDNPTAQLVRKALLACESCKRRKVKCDKRLPTCSFCQRKKLQCDYAQSALDKQHGSPNPPKSQSLFKQGNFPAVYFLDYYLFETAQVEIPTIPSSIPAYISDLVGDRATIRSTAACFFDTIHRWMPIISQKQFRNRLLNPLLPVRADVMLLCLCMKLLTWYPTEDGSDPQTATYLAAKQHLYEIEAAGALSLQALQAAVLISVYELGHAIYPAAYMSASSCARYASALDLGWQANAGSNTAWVDEEERRRAWWSVVILDRIVTMGCPKRPLVIEDPRPNTLLPADEEAWDAGVPNTSAPIMVSSPSDAMGTFALLALASYLLGRVLHYVRDPFAQSFFSQEEAFSLHRTLLALTKQVEENFGVGLQLSWPQVAICYSSLIVLHTRTTSLEPGTSIDTSRRSQASHVLEGISQSMVIASRTFLQTPDSVLSIVSPLVLHCTYQAGIAFMDISRAAGSNESHVEDLRVIKDAFHRLTKRWKAADVYLQLLEAREMMSS